MRHAEAEDMQGCRIMVIAESKRIERDDAVVAAVNELAVGRMIKGSWLVIGYLLVQCAQRREGGMGFRVVLHVGKSVIGARPHAALTVNGHTVNIV